MKGELYPCKPKIFALPYEDADHVVPEEQGRAAYERYLHSSDGKSLVSGTEHAGRAGAVDRILLTIV